MIKFTKDRYYLGIWFGRIPEHVNRPGDFMACAHRKLDEPTTWEVQFRFRYYTDGPEAFNKDEKHWYRLTAKNRTAESIETHFTESLQTISLMPLDYYSLDCNGTEAGRKLVANPPDWMHMRHEEKTV